MPVTVITWYDHIRQQVARLRGAYRATFARCLTDHLATPDNGDMTTTAAPKVGDIVTGRPLGQKRRQTVKVWFVDQDGQFVHGYLLSKKYPGNYRGQATIGFSSIESVEEA